MFGYQPGVLVKCKSQGEMGIVLKVLPNDYIIVFMGDGLTGVYFKRDWDIVPFDNSGAIPASFSEIVEGYLAMKERAERMRRKP